MPGSSRSRARNLDNAPDLAAVSLRRSVPAARTSQPVKRRHPSPSNGGGGGGGGGGSGNGEHTQQRQRHRTARKSKPVCWASLRLLSAPVQRAVTPLSHGSASGVSESSSEPSTPGTHLLDGESDSESGRSTPTSSQEKSLISLFATSTLIGRSSKCDVCVNDARVSSRHCIIERDSSTRRPYLTNLSRNGITISSQGRSTKLRSKGQAVPLEDKDTLMLVWEKPTLTYEFRFTKPRTLESESVLFAVRSNQHVSFTFNSILFLCGRYVVGKQLGSGAFGTVRLAQGKHSCQVYALKTIEITKLELRTGYAYLDIALLRLLRTHLLSTRPRSRTIRARLEQEVAIMHKLHHPHIIRVYDVFRTQDRMSMVLEYAKYGDLEEKLGQYKKGFPTKMVRPFCPRVVCKVWQSLTHKGVGCFLWQAYKIFQQIGSGLVYLHSLKPSPIAHRDLKPANCLVTAYTPAANGDRSKGEEMTVKLCDFGTSKAEGKSMMKTLVGTPFYTAPEIMNNSGHSIAVDMWSVGVMLFEFLFRDYPFRVSDALCFEWCLLRLHLRRAPHACCRRVMCMSCLKSSQKVPFHSPKAATTFPTVVRVCAAIL